MPHRSNRAFIARSPVQMPLAMGLVAGCAACGRARCSSAAIRSRQPARSCTLWPGSRNLASPPSRLKTKSPPSPRPLARSYAGQLGVTSSSGPGIALKSEAIGLAVMTELPLVIVNSQRGGPSTGLPTKTEQSDLYQAVYGRNGDTPLPVIAARSPGDVFDCAIEAVRIATQFMTPVILLTDGYIANAAEPWKVPDHGELYAIPGDVPHRSARRRLQTLWPRRQMARVRGSSPARPA